jgi:integrase
VGTLTGIQIKNWIKKGEPLAKSDGDGLTFTLSEKGTASWILRYSLAGRYKEITIGRFPEVSLADARKIATTLRARIQQGEDVARTKRLAIRQLATAKTFRELAQEYLSFAENTKKLAPATLKQRKYHINDLILPKLGSLAASEVTTSDVVYLVESVGKTNSYHVASLVLIALSKIFQFGISKHAVRLNPCVGITASAICGAPKATRERLKLTENELRVILPLLPSIGVENGLAIKILLSTCVRTGELVKAKWEDLNFEKAEWTIPAVNSKTKRGYIVPLPSATLGWFKELKQYACGSDFVLPARTGRKSHISLLTIGVAVNKLCNKNNEIRSFTPHDLRSTGRSYLSDLGVNIIVAERCLNHSLGGLIDKYDKNDFISERRAALKLWTDLIVACEEGRAWHRKDNIVQLRNV